MSSTITYAPPTSSAPPVARPKLDDEPTWGGLALTTWIKIGLVTLLMGLLFWPNLWRLWSKTNPFYGEPNWQHSALIPLVGLYYLYTNRQQLLAMPVWTAWSGLPFVIGGILLFAYGIWPGQDDFVKDFGMVITLFGVVLVLCGWQVMRIAWFPIAFLICGIPWPGLVYSWIAGPLQRLAAWVAVFVLQLANVDASNEGNRIVMDFVRQGAPVHRVLNVAEACSGLKSLMTFVSLAAAIAFLSARSLWQKLLIVLSAVPIAIFCNVMRVSGQGLLDRFAGSNWSEGFAHQFVGLVMLMPAFLLILGVGWVLDQVFIDEVEDKAKLKAKLVVARQQRRPAAPAGDGAGAAGEVRS